MSRLILTLISAILLMPALHAATPEQMEKARAIAFKNCLRYMNNGSGYLDDLATPSSTSALEKDLKDADRQNLSKLKSIPMPAKSEYSKWDQGEFDKYWTVTFFDNKALTFDSKAACRKRVAAKIKQIKVTTEAEKPAPTPTETAQAATAPTAQPEPTPAPQTAPVADAPVVDTAEAIAPLPEATQEKSNSNTPAIIILCVLVLVVVFMVAYALNMMKKNRAAEAERQARSSRRPEPEDDDEDEEEVAQPVAAPQPLYAPPHEAYMPPTAPQPEPEPAPQPYQPDLRDEEIAALRAESAALRRQLDEARAALQKARAQLAALQNARPTSPAPSSSYTPTPTAAPRRRQPRILYLGAPNPDGTFRRCDASYNMGKSLYKLITTDGFSGSFSLVEDPTVYDMALAMPDEMLAGACVGRNLTHPGSARTIVNEGAGTAVFEGGRWHVTRKARIRYSA